MDFLLECIGFPPQTDLTGLAETILAEGEPTPWRGTRGRHLRMPLTGGLEVQLDQELAGSEPILWPHYRPEQRLRVAVQEISRVPDSPFDALLRGDANPPVENEPQELHASFPLCTYLIDARRLPSALSPGHVLAVSVAGFALDVSWVGPNSETRSPQVLDLPHGAALQPLGGRDGPGGCMELSARVHAVRHLQNPLTGVAVDVLMIDTPGRPLELFVSRWQLEVDALPMPRPGWRIEGSFVFTGRIAGGLPPTRARQTQSFG